MPGSHHDRVASTEARPIRAEHVGQRREDEIGDSGCPERIDATGAERVRRQVGARGVDHRAGQDLVLLSIGRAQPQHERCVGAAGGAGTVHPLPRHGRHRGTEVCARGDRIESRERGKVALDELGGERECVVGREDPGIRFEEDPRSRVDQEPPRREQADVPPRGEAARGGLARLEQFEVDAALHEVCGCGEAHGAGADDRDGQGGEAGRRSDRPSEFDERHSASFRGHRRSSMPRVSRRTSTFVNMWLE